MPSPYSDEQQVAGVHKHLLDQVPPNSRVLDLGCWTGYYGRYLAGRGCAMVGVEQDHRAAELAASAYDSVVRGDLSDARVLDGLGRFDAVLLLDVLEHLANPLALLLALQPMAEKVYTSIPNVAHWSTRKMLFRGRWDYANSGILDRTHLRFFTIESSRRLLDAGGWTVEWEQVEAGPLPLLRSIGGVHRSAARLWPSLLGVQVLRVASLAPPPES